jgi:hypothetical protein
MRTDGRTDVPKAIIVFLDLRERASELRGELLEGRLQRQNKV